MPCCAHQGFHIGPGRVGAFGQGIGALIDLSYRIFKPDVGNADVVDIREDQGDLRPGAVPIFDNYVEFSPHITARFLYF